MCVLFSVYVTNRNENLLTVRQHAISTKNTKCTCDYVHQAFSSRGRPNIVSLAILLLVCWMYCSVVLVQELNFSFSYSFSTAVTSILVLVIVFH